MISVPASSGRQADWARAGGLAQREQGSDRQAEADRSMPMSRAAADACTIDSGALGTLAVVLCAFRNSSACTALRPSAASNEDKGV